MRRDAPRSAAKALGSNRAVVAAALLAALAGCADDASTTGDGGVATPCTPSDCGAAPPCPSVDYGAVAVAPTPPATAANCPSPSTIISALVQAQAKASLDALAAERTALLDPGKVTVVACGTGGPMPSARAQSSNAWGRRATLRSSRTSAPTTLTSTAWPPWPPKAGVKTLMLVHMTPSPADQAQATQFFGTPMESAGYSGNLVLAADGTKEILNVAK
jgi:hypothetical protein